jgi:hypothetical protein
MFNVNNRNYAGLREMVYALEDTNEEEDKLRPLSAQRVIWDEVSRVATVRVTDRQTGNLVSKDYIIAQASEDNGFLVIDNRIVIGVRELARLANVESYLDWYNAGYVQYVSLNDQKKIIRSDGTDVTNYISFSANDDTYLTNPTLKNW